MANRRINTMSTQYAVHSTLLKTIQNKLRTTCHVLRTTPAAFAAGSFTVNVEDEVQSRVAINQDLGSFVSRGFSAVILVAGLATFMYLVYGGLQWIMSGGDKGKLEEARAKITNGVIGLAIVASSWAIYLLLDYFFGIGITK
jgi:hypothetical protein